MDISSKELLFPLLSLMFNKDLHNIAKLVSSPVTIPSLRCIHNPHFYPSNFFWQIGCGNMLAITLHHTSTIWQNSRMKMYRIFLLYYDSMFLHGSKLELTQWQWQQICTTRQFFQKHFFLAVNFTFFSLDYSAGQKKRYEYCFMKQKCKFQTGIPQYENVATPLKTQGINTTHQHFQMRYITLF